MRVFLCEKPSQGRDIARVAGAGQRGKGCCRGDGIAVTWCIGHLLEAVPPEGYGARYRRWALELLPIIPARWQVAPRRGSAAQLRVVRMLLAQASEVVIATDADREGEMIAREVLEFCGYRGPVRRLWLSALNDASIRRALGALRPGAETLPLYHSALARSRADWLVGMNLSRLFTLRARQAGHRGVLSVGRVQTPTLKLVVDRDREIAGFTPLPYWTVDVTLSCSGQPFAARWMPPDESADAAGRCLGQPVALTAADRMRAERHARVVSVRTTHEREAPPLPFDLGTLQQVCSRELGLSPQETLDAAQTLYERHKATTYPRTDCRYLPRNMLADVPAVLDALLAGDPALAGLLEQLDRKRCSRAWNDGRVRAHHGMVPTLAVPRLAAMAPAELAVYRLIRARYLAQFLPDHEFDRTVVQLACGGQVLQAAGRQEVASGWQRAVEESRADAGEDGSDADRQALPTLVAGQACVVQRVDLQVRRTRPPRPYTQGELIGAMKHVARLVKDPRLKQKLRDTAGIGTEATRAGIIQGLLRRGYLVQKGRAVRAGEAAFMLIDAVPAVIADPATTAVWEQALDGVAAGQMTVDDFVARQSEWVRRIVASETDGGARGAGRQATPAGR